MGVPGDMGIPSDFVVINTPQPEVDRIVELIKRLKDREIATLCRLLADDYMADKLIPGLEAEIMDRDNPLTRINDCLLYTSPSPRD